jgi:hypothetical protein
MILLIYLLTCLLCITKKVRLKKKKEFAGSKVHWVQKGKNHHSMLQDPPEPILDASIF